jgi:uncharacterized integral membrane protein
MSRGVAATVDVADHGDGRNARSDDDLWHAGLRGGGRAVGDDSPAARRIVMAQDSPSGGGGERGRLGGGAIASLIGLALLVIFMVQNREKVTLHFLSWNFTWPLWVFTLVVALVGALVWFGLGVMRRHRRRRNRRG